MRKHILVISQYFYPESFRINDMATEWVNRGYKVTVLTGIPNYPLGKFFTGYSWTKRRHEKWNGMDIIRIPLFARGRTPIGMVLNYFSFVVSGWFWNRFNKIDADLVFSFEVSPMMQVKVGCGYANKHKVPHFLYVQDLWPENVETVTGIHNPLIIKPIDRMVDNIYKQVDKIFVTSPSFVEAVINRKVKVVSSKVYYWPQYAEDYYKPMEKKKVPEITDDNKFKIIFTGNIGYAQGLDILPKTAKVLKNKGYKDRIQFVIVGDGRYSEQLKRDIAGVLEMFIMIPRQPAERIPELLAACDVAFLSFQDNNLWKMTIPAKLQSYMACGMPVIASAEGETERIISEANCGVCSRIGDVEKLCVEIIKMMNTDLSIMRLNSRKYYETHFDKKTLMNQMEAFITS